MKFVKRIKTLRLFKRILKRIKNNKVRENEIEKLLNSLRALEGGKITDDYIKDVNVLLYIAKKGQAITSGNWVQLTNDELTNPNCYNKMKDIIDTLEANTFIHHNIASIGGNITFELTYKDNFNRFMYLKLKDKLDVLKFYKSTNPINKFLNIIIERTDQIVIGIILIIIAYVLNTYVLPKIL